MSEYKIASRYAKALFDKAKELKVLDTIKADMEHLKKMTEESRDFRIFLNSPLYKKAVKQNSLDALFSSSHELTKGMYKLMVDKFRETYIPAMGKAFIQMYNKDNNIVDVYVESALGLDKKVLNEIEAFVKKETEAKSVVLHTSVDKEIMGGVTIEFEGKIFDNTVLTQLKNIKKELQIA
jgi:F-type H+-transporting ATPase subunit delta